MNSFSKTSLKRLETCHKDLQLIMKTAIKLSAIDFGITEGYRSVERQKQLFDEGKSQIDGITKKGKHNYNPSSAVDVFAWVNNKASWKQKDLNHIAGVILGVAGMLKAAGQIEFSIRWGGNWDGDGVILDDQTFDDLPHFELI